MCVIIINTKFVAECLAQEIDDKKFGNSQVFHHCWFYPFWSTYKYLTVATLQTPNKHFAAHQIVFSLLKMLQITALIPGKIHNFILGSSLPLTKVYIQGTCP